MATGLLVSNAWIQHKIAVVDPGGGSLGSVKGFQIST